MENNVKEIVLPEGWVVDKIDNGIIILKEDDSKPIIKWNKEKDGVEVKVDGYYFVVANMPNILSNWYDAQTVCEKWGGYLPSVEELKVVAKYLDAINQCFRENDGFPMEGHFYWSSSEYSRFLAHGVGSGLGLVDNCGKGNNYYCRGFAHV